MRDLTLLDPPDIAAALALAAARIGDAHPTTDVLLAELAIGRVDRARAMLRSPAPDPLAAARYAAWTGDLHAIAAAWERLRPIARDILADPHAPDRQRICAELERTATDIGDVRLAADLHRGGRVDAAGRTSRATPADADAATILRIVHAVAGIEPDAPRHRLRLRPRLPDGARGMALRGIAFAGGSVHVDIHRDGRAITCRVGQDAGAIPVTVLLEPYVEGAPVATFVDDRPARLDSHRLADGLIVPVQLVLDEERVLRIELEG